MSKTDTKFGKLINLALKHRYGENFIWNMLTIVNEGDDNYIVTIDKPAKHINPAIVCFQLCKHLKTTNTEDGEAVYCNKTGECPLGKGK